MPMCDTERTGALRARASGFQSSAQSGNAPSRYGALLTLAPPRHARGSGDPVVAPERHEVAVEVIAQRDDLGLEAAAQLAHETLIWLGRIRHHNAPLQDLL